MVMAMNPEIKAQWTAALRSGEYEQGQRALNKNGKLCCLGVLCELAVKAGIVTKKLSISLYEYGDKTDVLPRVVVEWAGVPESFPGQGNPCVTVDDREVSLAELNDGENGFKQHTFAQIADIIDAQL